MVTYTSAFLAVANLLALAQAAPAQPVCFAVTTVITGSPVWVPRADPTTSAGWGAWPPKGSSSVTTTTKTGPVWTTSSSTGKTTWTTPTSSGGEFYPVSSTSSWTTSSIPVSTITVTPSTTTTTPAPSTTTPAPAPAAPTCDATAVSVFSATPAGSCGCEFSVTCNRHAPYTSSTSFWERTTGEIIGSLQECQNICNDNSECQAAIWVNRDGAPDSEYMRCWQTKNLPQPDSDGYGQLSFKGSCSSSCSQSYTG